MRIDVVTIFPDYLAPLELSLPGKAQASGLLDLRVHDLRAWAHDRHHTVDDTPYGGGAGMVMKPDPWGEAFDELAIDGAVVIVPTPSGAPFTQAMARELSAHERLVFACGRYEGIDQRVMDHLCERADLREVSLGDFVLNGGEVAALAITEAVVRLLPGFMGNPESLSEESHEDGLLEYPVYTKPASWRSHEVPEVLLSGDHGKIADWRRVEAMRRTVERRPDLLSPTALLEVRDADEIAVRMRPATLADAGEILTLQRACWVAEQQANPGVGIHALHETLQDVRRWLGEWDVRVLREDGRLIGAVRAKSVAGEGEQEGKTASEIGGEMAWDIGRIMVAPDLQGRGLGRQLLAYVEQIAPAEVTSYELFTGANSQRNIRLYKKAGYRLRGPAPGDPGAVRLTKPRR